jgi:hypothetical protein
MQTSQYDAKTFVRGDGIEDKHSLRSRLFRQS